MDHTRKIKKQGLVIKSLPRGGALFAAGLRPRDRITAVNGGEILDELDFYYHASQGFLEIEIERGDRFGTAEVEREAGRAIEVEFYEPAVARCANKCVFCFIDQMPTGLRRGLYIKDEDVKHSFLNGNYVTLTNMTRKDLERIASIGLSPLFVSVHATAPEVRARMLGRKRSPPDIREQLGFLRDSGIAFHTQIVVCPGYNDGAVLCDTVRELFAYGKSLLSIAVVPVGLTKFRDGLPPLAQVGKSLAVDICGRMGEMSDRMKAADGVRKLFLADEFFIKAGYPIPSVGYYEDWPQIGNGVGLVRQLLLGSAPQRPNKKTLVVTGVSAYPYIKEVFDGFDVVAVENRYMGETVTVAGLLTARDVIRKIKSIGKIYNEIILPGVMFNYDGYTLDGYSLSRIQKIVKTPVRAALTVEDITS